MNLASFYREAGLRIRAARIDKRMSQGDLAERIGLTRTSIVNIEAGRQKMLLHTFLAIERALGVAHLSLMPNGHAHKRDVLHVASRSRSPRFLAKAHTEGEKNAT